MNICARAKGLTAIGPALCTSAASCNSKSDVPGPSPVTTSSAPSASTKATCESLDTLATGVVIRIGPPSATSYQPPFMDIAAYLSTWANASMTTSSEAKTENIGKAAVRRRDRRQQSPAFDQRGFGQVLQEIRLGTAIRHLTARLSSAKDRGRTHASDTDSVAWIERAGARGRHEEPVGPARRLAVRGVRPPRRRTELSDCVLCGSAGWPLRPPSTTVVARPWPTSDCWPVLVLHRALHRFWAPTMCRCPGLTRTGCRDHHTMLRRMVSVSMDRSLPRPAGYPGVRLLPVVGRWC